MPSKIHDEACKTWYEYIRAELSGCIACHFNARDGVEQEHECPVRNVYGEVISHSPRRLNIAWVCSHCAKVHAWRLGTSAKAVLREKKAPGFSVRPDLTLLDDDGKPVTFIEFRGTHAPRKAEVVANREGIPLFVVDANIRNNLQSFQPGLNNPQRGMWQAVAEAAQAEGLELDGARRWKEDNYWADRANYQMMESTWERENAAAASYCPITDSKGQIVDSYFHAAGKATGIPDPSLGTFLIASRSNMTCQWPLFVKSVNDRLNDIADD